MIRTRLTDLLGLRYPIVSAPMAGPAGGALAAAVSEAGALGLIGAGTSPAEWVRAEVALAREGTQGRFGAGFLTHLLAVASEGFEAALDERLAVYAFSFDDPAPYVERVHELGALALCQVQTVEQAARAVEVGADVLAVQGNEAGGHTGRLTLLPFLSEVLGRFPEAVVIAAGSIGDARSLAAVIAAGADGAWIGTPFIATPESLADGTYKRRVVESDGANTVFTEAYDTLAAVRRGVSRLWPEGIGGRVLRDRFVEEWHGREEALRAHWDSLRADFEEAERAGTPRALPHWASSSAAAVTSVRPAAEVVREIGEGAERLLRERAATVLTADG